MVGKISSFALAELVAVCWETIIFSDHFAVKFPGNVCFLATRNYQPSSLENAELSLQNAIKGWLHRGVEIIGNIKAMFIGHMMLIIFPL